MQLYLFDLKFDVRDRTLPEPKHDFYISVQTKPESLGTDKSHRVQHSYHRGTSSLVSQLETVVQTNL